MRNPLQSRMFTSVFLSAALTFALVAAITYASTTISTNIVTAGDLTVSGTANLDGGIAVDTSNFTVSGTTGAVVTASTLTVGDVTTLTGAVTANGAVTINNTLAVVKKVTLGGTASTTIDTTGFIGFSTTTPRTEIAASGAATTTLYLSSSAKGSCIELNAPNGTAYRMYVSTANTQTGTTTPNGGAGFIAIWEAGSCKSQ